MANLCTTTSSMSNSRMEHYPKEKLYREKFALLARVGVNKRKASAYQEAEEFYCSLAIEQAAELKELLDLVRTLSKEKPELLPVVGEFMSRQQALVRKLFRFWPKNTDSQSRV